jgi:hypothetical protein
MVLTIERTGNRFKEVKVHYATSNGTAQAGSDYTASSGTVTFPSGGAATQTISIAITNDRVLNQTRRSR